MQQTQNNLIKHMRENQATTQDNAINLDQNDKSIFIIGINPESCGYIIKTKEGKYYLDEKTLAKQQISYQKAGLIIFLIGVIILVTAALIIF